MWEPVIGLEVHAQLQTATKLFCGCSTAWAAPPNTQTCPVCLGLPGALPVLNGRAVDLALTAAIALGCRIAQISVFARKNYFYPDLPKGYQITQFDRPLAVDGRLRWSADDGVREIRVVRVHIEEDAGKSLHEGFADSDRSTYLDFNRSGVPLIEIVTAPDLRSAEDGADAFRQLHAMLVAVGVTDGNMDQGSLRCDANISIRRRGDAALGTRAEIKNLNSFRFLQHALAYEIERQTAVLEGGGQVEPGTRLWDERAGETVLMRGKEDAHDYRYFPEPDLPPLVVEAAQIEGRRAALPELPSARRARLASQYGLGAETVDFLAGAPALCALFERTVGAGADAAAAAGWVKGDLARRLHESGRPMAGVPLTPASLARLIALVAAGTVSSTAARTVFARMFETGEPPDIIARALNLIQDSDVETLRRMVTETLDRLPVQVAQYRAGREAVAGFLVGAVMKASQGRANPALASRLVHEYLTGVGPS